MKRPSLSDTKHLGDIAEQAAIFQALKRGFSVSQPIGDNNAYDLIFDNGHRLLKIQVKTGRYNDEEKITISTKHGKNNRSYSPEDFDFAQCYEGRREVFYIFPVREFIDMGSSIVQNENWTGRGRKSRNVENRRDSWYQLEQ